MNGFDKACAALAAVLGVILIILGLFGLFFGSSANFTLPPVLGALPAIVGWGIARSVWVAWRVPRPPRPNATDAAQATTGPPGFPLDWSPKQQNAEQQDRPEEKG